MRHVGTAQQKNHWPFELLEKLSGRPAVSGNALDLYLAVTKLLAYEGALDLRDFARFY